MSPQRSCSVTAWISLQFPAHCYLSTLRVQKMLFMLIMFRATVVTLIYSIGKQMHVYTLIQYTTWTQAVDFCFFFFFFFFFFFLCTATDVDLFRNPCRPSPDLDCLSGPRLCSGLWINGSNMFVGFSPDLLRMYWLTPGSKSLLLVVTKYFGFLRIRMTGFRTIPKACFCYPIDVGKWGSKIRAVWFSASKNNAKKLFFLIRICCWTNCSPA
jgi:hypothetical protein